MSEEARQVTPAMLEASPLFAGFTPTGLSIFAQIARLRDVPRGLSLYRAGAAGDALCIVHAGTLEVVAGSGPGEVVVDTLGPGAHFGELALVRRGQRLLTVRAQSAAQVVELRHQDFQALLAQKPQACLKLLLAILAQVDARLREASHELLPLLA